MNSNCLPTIGLTALNAMEPDEALSVVGKQPAVMEFGSPPDSRDLTGVWDHAADSPASGCGSALFTDREALTRNHRLIKGRLTQGAKTLHLGPMRLHQHGLSILLVFGKEDAQSDALSWAAKRAGHRYNLTKTEKTALDSYQEEQHDVIVVDARHSKYFDPESLCRQFRALKDSQYTVILAVTKPPSHDKEEPSILPLLNAGFNKRFLENANVGVCMNELLTLERGEVCSQIKLRAAEALTRALDQVSDAVEITNENREIQYVNASHERLFGYCASEVMGKDVSELSLQKSEKNKQELVENMNVHLNTGKSWEGLFTSQRKSGECISHHLQIVPIMGQNGKVRHFVSTKTPLTDLYGPQITDRFNGDISSLSGMNMYRGHRRESILRMHSMTIEAPITQVINIINAAQENSPVTVSQSLDKVLEILRSSELYSPYFNHQVKDDQMTHDLVGGLMTTNVKRYSSGESSFSRNVSTVSTNTSQPSILTQASPEIQNLLMSEEHWNFNIIELERVTKKKPLVHLALKTFRRFGVMEFLRISEKELALWLQLIEENYHSTNTYHNSTHAADVMHATAYFLCRDKIKNIFDQMDEVGCLLAAVVHDLDHPGRTNSFLVNAGNPLSLMYNDLAILESHHVSLAFRLTTRDPRVNIFKNLERNDYRSLRQQIIDMVLATEMTKHFEHLTKFVSSIVQPPMREEDVGSGKNSPDSTTSRARLTTPENRTLIKRVLIKCADVCNPLRPLNLCEEWAYRIADEYFQQTDEEKDKDYPVVMPVFDRKTCNVPKSQVSFIDFFINNMFETWDNFCDTPELMKHLSENYDFWKQREEAAESAKNDSKSESET